MELDNALTDHVATCTHLHLIDDELNKPQRQ